MRRFAYPIASGALAALALPAWLASWTGCGSASDTSKGDGGGNGGGGSDGATGSRGLDAGDAGPIGSCDDAGAPDGSDIVNGCGTVDPGAYKALAPELGAAAGIAYRYGPPCSEVDAGATPTWAHPQDQHYDNMGNGPGWQWQVGGPQASKTDQNLNDYASNQGQGIYVADRAAGATDAGDPGVVDLISYTMSGNTFAESPQLPWVYYGGGNPDVNVSDYQKARSAPLAGPIAMGRCYGNFGWCSNALIAFPDGSLVTTGSNTARNENTFQLPLGKIPTAIAVTNSSEFALVSVWDVRNLKGQVAVFALAGTCDGCEPGGKSTPYNWWGEWAEVYPGLRNQGNIGFIKLLGFVDLPGMMAPIEISASGDYIPNLDDQQGWMCTPDGKSCRAQPHDLTLSNETNRQSFVSGPNAKRYSKSGFAVVISKSERKAIFLDLKPLFAEVQTMYFGTPANFALTRSPGLGDDQWPFAFAYAPAFAPLVVKTITLSQPPTSVKTSLQEVNRAWVGTLEGTLHVYDVGGYGNDMPASPDAIAEVGTISVGKNPTWIAYSKHDWANPIQKTTSTINHEVIVVSRGDCRVDWVALSPDNNGGAVTRTLQDSRLIDPVSAEDNDNHGTESYLLTVADYGGRQIAQYRYGPVIFHTNPGRPGNTVAAACQPPAGCLTGSNGKDAFEFGGAYGVPGRPFRFTSANTP